MKFQAGHKRLTKHRVGVGAGFFTGAIAAAIALTATGPAARADTIELPEFPTSTGAQAGQEFFGLPPLYDANSYEQSGTYTNLLGYSVAPSDPLDWDHINIPGSENFVVNFNGVSDPDPLSVTGGTILGTTFGEVSTSSGLANIYEDNPFYATGSGAVDNINDVFAQVSATNAIEYGVQYLYLPDAATPVDELNFFGNAGEILFSIPVTGDLF